VDAEQQVWRTCAVREQVSQTDYKEDGAVFGSVLNHVTDGRWATGERGNLHRMSFCCSKSMLVSSHERSVVTLSPWLAGLTSAADSGCARPLVQPSPQQHAWPCSGCNTCVCLRIVTIVSAGSFSRD
jgi:hypothetical protein